MNYYSRISRNSRTVAENDGDALWMTVNGLVQLVRCGD